MCKRTEMKPSHPPAQLALRFSSGKVVLVSELKCLLHKGQSLLGRIIPLATAQRGLAGPHQQCCPLLRLR